MSKCGFRELAQEYLDFLRCTAGNDLELTVLAAAQKRFDEAQCEHELTGSGGDRSNEKSDKAEQ